MKGQNGVGSHLEEVNVLVLLTKLIEFRRDDLARTAPGSRVIDHNQLVASILEGIIELLS